MQSARKYASDASDSVQHAIKKAEAFKRANKHVPRNLANDLQLVARHLRGIELPKGIGRNVKKLPRKLPSKFSMFGYAATPQTVAIGAGVVVGGLIVGGLIYGLSRKKNKHHPKHQHRHDKRLRDELSDKQVDRMIMDSFPASDPASTY